MPQKTTRREWLARTSGWTAAVGLASMPWARTVRAAAGANDRVNLGLIGCGRRGRQLLDAVLPLPGVAVTAVCDVDVNKAVQAAGVVSKASNVKPATATDHRNLMDDPDLAGVIIATPDHWHSIMLLSACGAGKDAYVEVPLSRTIVEGQAMVFITRKYRRVVQTGLQYRSSPLFEEATRQVRSGALGRIAQTRSWSFARRQPIARQPDADPPPGLDYDRWLGPAPQRACNPARLASPEHWWDYGGGEAALWNAHLQDLMHAAMRVSTPRSITAVGGGFGLADFRETPDTFEASFEYQGIVGPFMHVYSLRLSNAHAAWGRGAGAEPPANVDSLHPFELPPASGVQFHGEHGTLCTDREGVVLLPSDPRPAPRTRPADPVGFGQSAALIRAHLENFVECMRTRAEPRAVIEAGHFASLPGHAANIAYRLGRKLYLEAAKQEFFLEPGFKTPDEEANALAQPQFRPPYRLPHV